MFNYHFRNATVIICICTHVHDYMYVNDVSIVILLTFVMHDVHVSAMVCII